MNLIYTMPNILTETSEGTTAHSLQDELFKDRQIELVGEITQESAYAIILQLRYLQKAAPRPPSRSTSTAQAARCPAAWPSMT